jgi:hypothetical protein
MAVNFFMRRYREGFSERCRVSYLGILYAKRKKDRVNISLFADISSTALVICRPIRR